MDQTPVMGQMPKVSVMIAIAIMLLLFAYQSSAVHMDNVRSKLAGGPKELGLAVLVINFGMVAIVRHQCNAKVRMVSAMQTVMAQLALEIVHRVPLGILDLPVSQCCATPVTASASKRVVGENKALESATSAMLHGLARTVKIIPRVSPVAARV